METSGYIRFVDGNFCRNAEGFVTRKMHIDDTPCDIHCQHMAKDWPCCCCGHTDASEKWYYDHDEELERKVEQDRASNEGS